MIRSDILINSDGRKYLSNVIHKAYNLWFRTPIYDLKTPNLTKNTQKRNRSSPPARTSHQTQPTIPPWHKRFLNAQKRTFRCEGLNPSTNDGTDLIGWLVGWLWFSTAFGEQLRFHGLIQQNPWGGLIGLKSMGGLNIPDGLILKSYDGLIRYNIRLHRDPYDGLLWSVYNWVGCHPLYNPTNRGEMITAHVNMWILGIFTSYSHLANGPWTKKVWTAYFPYWICNPKKVKV